MKQQEIAALLNVSVVHFSNIKRAISNASPDLAVRFGAFFKTDPSLWIFGSKKERSAVVNKVTGQRR